MINMEGRSPARVSSLKPFRFDSDQIGTKHAILKHEMENDEGISSNGDVDSYSEECNSEISSSSGETKEVEPKLAKSFPWLTQFVKLCRAEIGVTNINTLENLMRVYLDHVGKSATECYVKPNRAAKLKKCMNETLVLFHMLYSDIKKPLEHSSYLDKMSDLMAYYIDMEIKASRRGKESLPKIASKLTSSLYLFLDHSMDHILDAILKTKNMTKNFCELCSFIFKRLLKEGPGRTVYEMTYVRYILVFKMWKRVVKGADERRRVMKLAASKLFPPSQFRDKLKSGLLCGVLPKIPKSRPDITMFLMQAKFCVKEKSKEFLKVVADPKQHCVLGSSLSADLDRPLFFGEDTDSPNNSNSDDQEETSGSSVLMNDIWSSMTLEAGLRDHLRLAEVTGIKSKKSSKLKKKSINDSSKVESSKNLKDKDKKMKKKVKKISKCEEIAKNSSRVEEVEKKPNIVVPAAPEASTPVVHSTNEVNETCTQTLVEPVRESAESTPLIPIENIKVEADSSDDVCFVGIIRKGDDDLVTGSGNEAEILDIAREVEIRTETSESPVKLERPGSVNAIPPSTLPTSANQHDIFLYDQTPSNDWNPPPAQNFYNSAVCDFIKGYLPDFDLDSANGDLDNRDLYNDMLESLLQNKHKEIYPKEMFQGNDLSQLPLDEEMRNIGLDVSSLPNDGNNAGSGGGKAMMSNEPVTVGGEQQHHSPVRPEEHQEKIDDMIESFKEQGRYSEKNTENNVVSNNQTAVSSEVETKSKDNDSLHGRTLRSDHSIFISQHQFRSLYITEVIPPSIPVPSPPRMDSSSRCDCDQCNANYEALQTNYKKLTAYKNAKINNANTYKKPAVQEDDLVKGGGGSEEETEPGKNPRMEQHSSLPLKKRKALQTTQPLKKEAIETSYPCTPMMSIAVALEKSKVGLPASSATACNVLDYTTASSAQQYSYSSSVNSVSSAVPQTYSNSTVGYIIPAQIPYNTDNKTISSANYTVNAIQTTFQRTFKTPAQLKEGISVPTSDLNAAQDLINFAHNSHSYFSNTSSTNRKTSKRTRTKTKTERHSSKKKRN